jgi:hypothetical protein
MIGVSGCGVLGVVVTERYESVRHQFISLLQNRRFRLPKFSEMPYDWRPEQVLNPADGQPFTRRGAWHFIQEQLENRCAIEAVILDAPPGKTAYTMLLDVGGDKPDLYVKVQLGSGFVIGRSFHYSTRSVR